MGNKRLIQLIIVTLLLICLQGGCNFNDSGSCTAMGCFDHLTVKILPTDNYLSGRYSAELVFSDDVSITAEFELVPEAINSPNLIIRVIQNDSYGTSWFLNDEMIGSLEIDYRGMILTDDSRTEYEFTDEATINVVRDGGLVTSEAIAPDYNYYWCNSEHGKCDSRQNKDGDIEITID